MSLMRPAFLKTRQRVRKDSLNRTSIRKKERLASLRIRSMRNSGLAIREEASRIQVSRHMLGLITVSQTDNPMAVRDMAISQAADSRFIIRDIPDSPETASLLIMRPIMASLMETKGTATRHMEIPFREVRLMVIPLMEGAHIMGRRDMASRDMHMAGKNRVKIIRF